MSPGREKTARARKIVAAKTVRTKNVGRAGLIVYGFEVESFVIQRDGSWLHCLETFELVLTSFLTLKVAHILMYSRIHLFVIYRRLSVRFDLANRNRI